MDLHKFLNHGSVNLREKNHRKLFPNLNYDKLEKCLSKNLKGFFDSKEKISPSDLLHKVHVLHGLKIPVELRQKISEQESLIKGSPYLINDMEIKKQILDLQSRK